MHPAWVIEDFEHDNSFGPLAEEVKRQGYGCEVIRYEPLQSGSYDVFDNEGCVLFQGSINLALQLLRSKKWIPGPWLTRDNYECMKYYAHLGKYLFNDRYVILPRGDVRRRIDWLYNECFGHAYEDLFFRPSSGLKPWTAGVFNRPNFESSCLSRTSIMSAVVRQTNLAYANDGLNFILEGISRMDPGNAGETKTIFFRIPDELYVDFERVCVDAGISNILDGFRIVASNVDYILARQKEHPVRMEEELVPA